MPEVVYDMNGRVSKKIRKYARRNWIEYFEAMREWPLTARIRFSLQLIFKGAK
jgi:hypothetical protein